MSACPFAPDDGAYVLGALSPAERLAYERHLSGCARCRDAVSDIAVLPSLISRIEAGGVSGKTTADEEPPRVSELIKAAQAARRRERSVDRRHCATTGLVAAALALLLTLGVSWLGIGRLDQLGDRSSTPETAQGAVRMLSMQPLRDGVPVSAEIGLRAEQWGTEVSIRCAYAKSDYTRTYTFRLVAHGADGAKEQVGSWVAAPGDEISMTGSTRFTIDELVRLEVTRFDGMPLLAYDPP